MHQIYRCDSHNYQFASAKPEKITEMIVEFSMQGIIRKKLQRKKTATEYEL